MAEGNWFPTNSGKIVDFDAPDPAVIDWGDVAGALAKMCRFNGHITNFYSVAEHSYRVGMLMPMGYQIYGLLHDAAEAYVGDVIRPLKNKIRESYKPIELQWEAAIWTAADLPPPDAAFAETIHTADMVMLATERRDLKVFSGPRWIRTEQVEPDPTPVECLPWKEAERAWLYYFELWMTRWHDMHVDG